MDLTYIHETSEAEAIRYTRRFYRQVLRIGGVLCFGIAAFAVLHAAAVLLSPAGMRGESLFALLLWLVFLPAFLWLVRWYYRRVSMKMWRRQSSHRSEYRLTDDGFSETGGAIEIHAKWRDLASHYLLCGDALYLIHGGICAVIVPQWAGRGVPEEELVATLERAGVQPFRRTNGVVRRIVSVVLAAILIAYGCMELRSSYAAWRASRVSDDQERELHEAVHDGDPGKVREFVDNGVDREEQRLEPRQ